MARPKTARSPQTKYRQARERIADVEAEIDKLERSRPRSPAAKGWKTRRIAATRKALASARGQLTKAKNAIAAQTAAKRTTAKTTKAAAASMRSEAAKRGHETRRKRAAQPAPSKPSFGTGRFMPMLTEAGIRYVDPPAKDDRSAIGSFWNAVDTFLATGSTTVLARFEGRSIWDSASGRHVPFITDPNVVLDFHDEFDFGFSYYKSRGEVARMQRFVE